MKNCRDKDQEVWGFSFSKRVFSVFGKYRLELLLVSVFIYVCVSVCVVEMLFFLRLSLISVNRSTLR